MKTTTSFTKIIRILLMVTVSFCLMTACTSKSVKEEPVSDEFTTITVPIEKTSISTKPSIEFNTVTTVSTSDATLATSESETSTSETNSSTITTASSDSSTTCTTASSLFSEEFSLLASNISVETISLVSTTPANNYDYDNNSEYDYENDYFTYVANGSQTYYDIIVAAKVWTDDFVAINGLDESVINNIVPYGTVLYIPTYSKSYYDIDNILSNNYSENYYEDQYDDNYYDDDYYDDYSYVNTSGSMLGSCTLSLSSSWGSWQNIKISANALNGCIVYNGGSFNWFNTPGLGACEDGYELGGVFNQYGEPDLGLGGGVCFTVSCLNECAVYQCGMTPDSGNSCHSRAVNYIQYGHDATVDYPGQNYVFYNYTGQDVIFYASISEWEGGCGGRLTISCYAL